MMADNNDPKEMLDYPDPEVLLGEDADLRFLGFRKVFVSVFDHWLSREEYERLFPLGEDQQSAYVEARRKFYAGLEGDKYRYSGRYELLPELAYQVELGRLVDGSKLMNFYVPRYKMFVEGSYEHTDVIYYQDASLMQDALEGARECGLHVLEE
ncbi:hypothetical protein Rhal01_03220 [Rubritalea halochordaticola]|uniref:Uncharacterized protein n=1 Tax=Rubritalea halochordaticola TaxID=714537 RepID=A0ABP9V8U8_9BACT